MTLTKSVESYLGWLSNQSSAFLHDLAEEAREAGRTWLLGAIEAMIHSRESQG